MTHAQMWKPLLLAGAIAGCASAPHLPPAQTAASEASIRAAEAMGAANDPQAANYLRLARSEHEEAQRLVADGHTDLAALALERSRADADLATAIVHEDAAKRAAEEAVRKAPPQGGGTQ